VNKVVTRSGDWIPKDTLIAANMFAGASWIALLALAVGGAEPGSLPSLAFVHLVALGWLSLTALSVLIHVTPTFLGVSWTYESLARNALRGFAIAVAALVLGFVSANTNLLEWGGILTFAMLALYMVPASATIARGLSGDRQEVAISRALLGTLFVFVLVAALGVLFGFALNGHVNAAVLVSLPQAHAILGIAGWLTLLVFGVSTATMRAINAAGSRWPVAHVVASVAVLAGAIAFALAAILPARWLFASAGAVLALGVTAYAANLVDILRRNAVPNRVPQAFVAAAVTWLLCALVLGIGTMTGKPWGAAFVYVALVGWLGAMVNAHVFHIGIRLLITTVRGDEDETRPWTILNQPLALAVWALFQIAVALGTLGLATHDRAEVEFAAASGLISWVVMIVTISGAYRRLRASVPEAVDAS
jgi:hypothetical protein